MFDRSELEIAIGITLTAAIVVGWLLHALGNRLSPTPQSQAGRMAVMARRLHEAEEARDAAIAARSELETTLETRMAEHQRSLADLDAQLTAAAARREAELQRELREAQADRDASMDGLRAGGMTVEPASEQLVSELKEIGVTMTAEWLDAAGEDGKAIVDAFQASN